VALFRHFVAHIFRYPAALIFRHPVAWPRGPELNICTGSRDQVAGWLGWWWGCSCGGVEGQVRQY